MTASFTHLLAAYQGRILRASLGWLGNEQEAREAAQDTLLKAYAARDRYDDNRPFYPWLHTIAHNTCRDALARRSHRAHTGLDTQRVADDRPSPEGLVATGESVQALRVAMATLSDDYKEVLVLRHFEDLSYAEIGEIIGIPKGTVMSRLYRARRALTHTMNPPEAL